MSSTPNLSFSRMFKFDQSIHIRPATTVASIPLKPTTGIRKPCVHIRRQGECKEAIMVDDDEKLTPVPLSPESSTRKDRIILAQSMRSSSFSTKTATPEWLPANAGERSVPSIIRSQPLPTGLQQQQQPSSSMQSFPLNSSLNASSELPSSVLLNDRALRIDTPKTTINRCESLTAQSISKRPKSTLFTSSIRRRRRQRRRSVTSLPSKTYTVPSQSSSNHRNQLELSKGVRLIRIDKTPFNPSSSLVLPQQRILLAHHSSSNSRSPSDPMKTPVNHSGITPVWIPPDTVETDEQPKTVAVLFTTSVTALRKIRSRCRTARKILKMNHIPFTEIDLIEFPSMRLRIIAAADGVDHGIPVLFADDHFVCGFPELQQLHDVNKLADRMRSFGVSIPTQRLSNIYRQVDRKV